VDTVLTVQQFAGPVRYGLSTEENLARHDGDWLAGTEGSCPRQE
jgi:hypothetical protein